MPTIQDKISRTSKDFNDILTELDNFDICFCVIADHYCRSVISGSTKLRIFLIFLNFVFILLRGRSGSPISEGAVGHHRQGCRGFHPWSFVV